MKIKLVPYEPRFKEDFKLLNEAWISKYFVMEAADHKSLDDPDGYVISQGGYIVMACEGEKAIGTCGLFVSEYPQFDYELAKMAVSTAAQGKGVGRMLGEAIIAEAKKRGGDNLFLESNRMLIPAINLYRRLGFTEVEGFKSPYARSNIQMSMSLQEDLS